MRAAAVMFAALPLFVPCAVLAQGATAPLPAASSAAPDTAAPPAGAAATKRGGITCAQIPDAQRFVDGLRPGPNTREAQRHLDAAKSATSDRQCVAELRQVNVYARRSSAADKRLAAGERHPHRRILCADPLHQNRPGGTDYKGPPVTGCPAPRV
ncbi:MAG TPA: hypothetical protein VN802_12515 [Stellaceae bacterium]|nr:hypothetical protein [Stellaceae bacterium]